MKIPEAIRQDKNIKWILLIGLLQTAACAVTYWFRISNPNIILFVILSAVLVQFGYKAGILCGGIIYLYTMFYFSIEHSFWLYRKDRLRRSFELKMPAGRRATQIDDLGIKKDKNLPH